jgi:hypothetical protein
MSKVSSFTNTDFIKFVRSCLHTGEFKKRFFFGKTELVNTKGERIPLTQLAKDFGVSLPLAQRLVHNA